MSDPLTIEIISIGDELLTGHIANTNAAWMADQLLQIGLRVNRITTVGDDEKEICEILRQAESRADLIMATGGLGPTHDDVTRTALCEYFTCKLVVNKELLEDIKSFFGRRGIPMARVNTDQARVPATARLLKNDSGTAPGYVFSRKNTTFYFLAGVPHEMRSMMARIVLPELSQKVQTRLIRTRYLCTIGIAESTLYEQIGGIDKVAHEVRVAFLPGFSGVKIRLSAEGENEAETEGRLARAADYLRQNIAPYVYSERDMPLEQALALKLSQQRKTIAVAESCTGGLLAHKFTNIPGSSNFFERGVVTYSNRAKIELLGVPASTIEAYGAVSEQVALAMAEGVRRLAKTDYGLSTTGIAGPDGGSDEKPVGLVYVAWAGEEQVDVNMHRFIGDRHSNKERFAYAALNVLRINIKATGEL
ncbi:competence/damage-inducible protein A [candidate division KSB1 bacterium]|nr:competence/damage-inducible protein A [candidate division KSB1 bacterium]